MLLALLCAGPAASEVAARTDRSTPTVRVVTNGFVLPGKFRLLADWASEAGLSLDAVNVEEAEGTPAQWLAGADLVILDTPRPNDRAMVEARLGSALAEAGVPWLQVGGGRPAFEGLPPPHARTLIGYYAHGGEANLRNMLTWVALWHGGGDLAAVAPPRALPETGFYHPQAPQSFATLDAYLAWGADRWSATAPGIAFAIHSGTLGNMQTKVVDSLVAGVEARGMKPLVFWFETEDDTALQTLFTVEKPAVIVNMQHMRNGSARLAEFLALDVPVVQTLTYRDGDIESWRSATSGVPMRVVAPFLSQPESWGMSDPLVIDAIEAGEPTPIPEQVAALLDKTASLVALRQVPPADKRLALMFWNHPTGEKNLAASHLNVPRSLERMSAALAEAGYAVPPTEEDRFIAAGQAMLAGYYRPETLDTLITDGLTVTLPLARYQAWLDGLPEQARTAVLIRWGAPQEHWSIREVEGVASFVIPAARLGNLLLMPQPPRAGRPGAGYHDTELPPDHIYLAAYQYVREAFDAHALIHLGTHGTQEWTPGKDRGLWTGDFPFLAVGDLPVFYPYIQDNIGEAIQARRRGRAVTVSHQTPAFAPAGLYDELRDLHGLVHEYGQLVEGAVRDRTAQRLLAAAVESDLHRDVGWSAEAAEQDFDGFLAVLHDHLHGLAHSAMPLGLHTFGEPAAPEHRLSTVMQQLGEPYYQRVATEPDEPFVGDFRDLRKTAAYATLARHLREGVAIDSAADAELQAQIRRAVDLDRHLSQPGEIEALLAGLAGRFVPPGSGGDPIRNPDVPSGRNLYAFEADKIPTEAAYEAGEDALRQLLDTYRQEHDGRLPDKLAFSLWSSEALRHLGVLESQVLRALGLRPVWDKGGRVVKLDIIPAAELGRPRIDVVVQVTSVYRDQFDSFMRLLAEAIDRLARLDETGNPIAANATRVEAELIAQGIAADRARDLASLRIFSNAPGDYGTGLPDMTLDSTHWEDDAPLAEQFLDRLQYGYGARDWGVSLDDANLFAKQLKGVQAAVLSRSTKLHGLVSTDHPFEFLGGLALAVRHLDGASPSLYVSDLRERQPKLMTAARFIADELRVRYLNPHWITTMQAEGYAGTLEVLNAVNNVWGWQVAAPETIRPDQWQAMHDTFVNDGRDLDLDRWFKENNPAAQAQLIERMVEAIRKEYWDAPAQTRAELAARWQALAASHDLGATPQATRAFIEQISTGYGTGAEAPPADAAASGAPPPPETTSQAEPPKSGEAEPVRGQALEEVAPSADPAAPWHVWVGLAALVLLFAAGAVWQARANSRPSRMV